MEFVINEDNIKEEKWDEATDEISVDISLIWDEEIKIVFGIVVEINKEFELKSDTFNSVDSIFISVVKIYFGEVDSIIEFWEVIIVVGEKGNVEIVEICDVNIVVGDKGSVEIIEVWEVIIVVGVKGNVEIIEICVVNIVVGNKGIVEINSLLLIKPLIPIFVLQ